MKTYGSLISVFFFLSFLTIASFWAITSSSDYFGLGVTRIPVVERQPQSWEETSTTDVDHLQVAKERTDLVEQFAVQKDADADGDADKEGNDYDTDTLVESCMKATHIDATIESPLLEQAKSNARHVYREYRELIPEKSLSGYRSHCWKDSFVVNWTSSEYSGSFGDSNISFRRNWKDLAVSHTSFKAKTRHFPQSIYKTKLLCLPNLFLAGFRKCGSTFTYCFISNLISMIIRGVSPKDSTLLKEPFFWVKIDKKEDFHLLTKSDLGKYLFYFAPGMHEISDKKKNETILLDAAPDKMDYWPIFRDPEQEHNVTNYCLLPSVLPKLLPDSKYIAVMRNPVDMLYSSFWYSCLARPGEHNIAIRNEEFRNIFHDRVMAKVRMFNYCMRDSSVPSLSHVCDVKGGHYSPCILQRIHLLDKCAAEIMFEIYSPEMPTCGVTSMSTGLYYIHVRKWLSVVSRDRLLFVALEAYGRDLSGTAKMILEFIGLKTDILANQRAASSATAFCRNRETKLYKKPQNMMRKDTRRVLETFYKPFNHLLTELVGEKMPW